MGKNIPRPWIIDLNVKAKTANRIECVHLGIGKDFLTAYRKQYP